MFCRTRFRTIGPILLFLSAPPSMAAMPDELCRSAAASAALETGVPVQLLLALTLTETGRATGGDTLQPWAWALNQGGDSHWFDTRDDALLHLADALAGGTTNIDVGCFQLNFRWHGSSFASLEDMIDPQKNALYAARHVGALYRKSGDWTKAVAAYHSSTPEYAERYLARFEPIYASLGADDAALAEEPQLAIAEDAAPGQNLFPLLKAGAVASAGSLVPLGGAARPLIGG